MAERHRQTRKRDRRYLSKLSDDLRAGDAGTNAELIITAKAPATATRKMVTPRSYACRLRQHDQCVRMGCCCFCHAGGKVVDMLAWLVKRRRAAGR